MCQYSTIVSIHQSQEDMCRRLDITTHDTPGPFNDLHQGEGKTVTSSSMLES